jgi:hypothetical protein
VGIKRIEFTIIGEDGKSLSEPGFVEDCSELPIAVMRAMEDFLEAHDGNPHLPITINVRRSIGTSTC